MGQASNSQAAECHKQAIQGMLQCTRQRHGHRMQLKQDGKQRARAPLRHLRARCNRAMHTVLIGAVHSAHLAVVVAGQVEHLALLAGKPQLVADEVANLRCTIMSRQIPSSWLAVACSCGHYKTGR